MKFVSIDSLVRENVKNLKPYSSARDEFQGTASVYLDANENPNNSGVNRYPDPHQVALKEKLGAIKHIPSTNIFLGNGSDEAIDLLIRAFCTPDKDNVVIPEPTYGMYSVSADVNAVGIVKVKLSDTFDIDVAAIQNAWDERSRILFLCSPNNPSGNLLGPEKIVLLLESFHGLVVVDEAYIDFTDSKSFLSKISKYPNLVVLQTLSKAWGMAGLRLGMCFAHTDVIDVLNKIKPPYNINILTQNVVLEKLQNEAQKNLWVADIRKERKILEEKLAALKIVQHIYPSDANFLLVQINDATSVYDSLVQHGIIVRDRSRVVLCDDCLRITVGTAAENKILIQALEKI